MTEVGSPGEERAAWIVRPPPGAAETTVLVSGFDAAAFDWSLPPDEIELKAFRSIEGVVLDDRSGVPLPGAEVALYGEYPRGLGRLGVTAPNGVFRIESSADLAARRLVVRASGYRPALLAENALASAVESGLVVVRLKLASALVGRITSQAGRGLTGSAALVGRQGVFAPPSAGSVDRFLPSNPGIYAVSGTDEDGLFRFAEVLTGVQSVAVGVPGHATRVVPLRSSAGDVGAPGEWTGWFDLGEIVLVPELAVEGVVRDGGGLAVAGASVAFGRSPDVVGAFGLEGLALPTGEVRTDTEGRFRVGGLGEGDLIDVVVEHPGHATVELPRVAVDRAADPVWLEIEMKRAVELVGRVVDEATGEGLEDVRVQLLDAAERRQLAVEQTGLNGRFALGGLASFDGVLRVKAFGYEALRHEIRADDGLHPAAGEGLVLSLRAGSATARGIVTVSGVPVVGAELQMDTKDRSTTDGAGRFELAGLPVGNVIVSCRLPGELDAEPVRWRRKIEPGVNEFVFDLTPVEIVGRAEDSAGTGISQARIIARRPLAPAAETQSGNDGSFGLVVIPGRYRVSADAQGYGGAVREIEVSAAEPPPIVLRLEDARELRVRVLGLGPEEAESAHVIMESVPLSPGGGAGLSRSADEAGTPLFVRANPPEGTVVVVARAGPAGRAERRTVEVLPRGVTQVEIMFDDAETNGRLSGLVTVDGSPLAGAPVFVIDERSGDAWAVRTDHRGTYVIDGLRRGRVQIAAVGERRSVNVDGESLADFRARSAVLAGRLVGADTGAAAGGIEIVAMPAHAPIEVAERLGQTAVSRSAEDGSFEIRGLFQASYRVVARRRGRVVGSAEVDLATWAGETLISVREAAVPE